MTLPEPHQSLLVRARDSEREEEGEGEGSDTSGTFSLHFAKSSHELERPALKTGLIEVGAEVTFVAANFLQKSP